MRSVALIFAAAVLGTCGTAAAQQAPHEQQARRIYERLISYRTAEGHDQVPAMAAYIAETLKAGGVAADDIAILPHGKTAAMIVRVKGTDAKAKPILFSAHMDVVDARPEDWSRDPFKLIEENGVFYGRGTIDNKAGVTAMTSTILRLKAGGAKPKRTLLFAYVGDEETEMATTALIAEHPWVKGAAFAINTDAGGGLLSDDNKPLIYLIQSAEKTYATFEVTAVNPGGHSSRPRADNAIYDLSRALGKIEAHRFPVKADDLTRSYLAAVGKVTPGDLGQALSRFAADPTDTAASERISKSPEFIGSIRTTCVATMLQGGHAENALPQKAVATVNCRIFPTETVEAVQSALVAAIDDPKITVKVLDTPAPSPVSHMRPEVMKAITQSIQARYPGVPVTPYLESGGTDGKIYRKAGIPTFASSGIFLRPSEMFAHGLNERLPVKAFYESLDHIYELAIEFGGR